MKKLFPAALLALIVFIGCNKEKIYKDNLNGKWGLYKYLLHNVDKTQFYLTTYGLDTVVFTSDGNFTEYFGVLDTNAITGTYGFADNDETLTMTNMVTSIVDSVEVQTPYTRKFRIFNLTGDHVQLRTDSDEFYWNKVK